MTLNELINKLTAVSRSLSSGDEDKDALLNTIKAYPLGKD